MPSYKKRVHSQRIPQRERPAVTPYEGSYDEKYSSDEENVEYDVYEPDDITERSNSTVTFSEDIYDSDAIDEMIRNQMRKASGASQEGSAKGEDVANGGKLKKSILKDGKSKGSKIDGSTPRPTDLQVDHAQGKSTQIIVSPPDGVPEGGAKMQGADTSGVNKINEKGEQPVDDVTKPLQDIITDTVTDKETWVKVEKEFVTKSPQSTIPLQIDKITDSSAATNKHVFAKNDEQFLENQTQSVQGALEGTSEQPLQKRSQEDDKSGKITIGKYEISQEASEILPEESVKTEKTETSISGVSHPEETDILLGRDVQSVSELKPDRVDTKHERLSDQTSSVQKDFTRLIEITNSTMAKKSPEESTIKYTASPTKEEAAETALKLVEDITKTVQDVLPQIPSKPVASRIEESTTINKAKLLRDWTIQNGEPKQLESMTVFDSKTPGITETIKSPLETKPEEKALPEKSKPEILPSGEESLKLETKPIQIGETDGIAKISEAITRDKKWESSETVDSGFAETEKLTEKHVAGDKVANGMAKVFPASKEGTLEVNEKSTPTVTILTEDIKSKLSTEKSEEVEKMPISAKDKQKSDKTADILVVESSVKTSVEATDRKATSGADSSAGKSAESKSTEPTSEKPTAGETTDGTSSVPEQQSPEKPRVIFRIDSEDDLHSYAESEVIPSFSPTFEHEEMSKQELKESLEKDQMKIEERLTSMKGRIFDISDESLLKTKELVDERLRKISEIKPPQELEESFKREKSPARGEEIKIGRFHITPALVEEVVSRSKEHEIAERLKTSRTDEDTHDEVEKELPEKLTEADLEEVIRELKKEGLKTDVYLQPEDTEKEEKKEKTLRRVERRFERMASETLEEEKEEGVSEEKLNEKREQEFQRMISNLSSEEVAEYQQEYLQLWDEGGLSSLTPTDDWESRDPDTPENELDEDAPRKSGGLDTFGNTSSNPSFYIKSSNNFKNNELIKKESSVNTYLQYDSNFNAKLIRKESESLPEDAPDFFGFEFDFSDLLFWLK